MKNFEVQDPEIPGHWFLYPASSEEDAAERFADDDFDMDYTLGRKLLVKSEAGVVRTFNVSIDYDKNFWVSEVLE